MKKLFVIISFAIFLVFFTHLIFAANSPWSQSDWSGGSGQTAWSDSTKFSSGSGVITSTANQTTLSLEKFSNIDFESNLDDWNGGTNPETITGMKLWLKADAITGLSDGDAVSTWTDSSGLSHDALQSDSNRRPTYETNVLNGEPVIRFNGTTHGMYVPDTTDLDATSGFSVFVVTTAQKSGADQVIVYKGTEDSQTYYNYRIIHWPDGNKYGGLNGTGGEIFYAFGTTSVGTPQILTSYWNGTNLYAYVNGSQAGNAAANVTGVAHHNDFQIGYNKVTNADFMQGDIAEIIVYNSIITDAQRQQVEAYLQAKYAISSGYGTITRDTTTTHGSSAGSAKVVVGANATDYVQSVNVGNTDSYDLVAYAYTDGSAVTSTNAELVYDGSTVSTTYTSVGSGWYKLSGSITGVNSSKNFGVRVKANQTVYLDDMSLRDSDTITGTLTSSIFDSGFSSGANWGTLTYSATTPSNTTAAVKVRTGGQSDLSDATAFSSCTAITSGSEASGNGCVTDGNRYAQYQISLSTTDNTVTSTFSNFSLAFSDAAVTPAPTSSSNTSSSSSSSGPSSCTAQAPSSAPDLFQISTSPDTATLYFSPANPATGYIINYGLNSSADQHSASFDYSNEGGAIFYTIGSLAKGTTYNFRVQAKNGCKTGPWSKTLSETTTGAYFPQRPSDEPIITPTPTPKPQGEIVVTEKEVTSKPKASKEGYDVKVFVQKDGKPIEGVAVELHSTPRRTKTDKDGIARFENVEGGDHTVTMAYAGYQGEEKITLNGENKEVNINLTVKLEPYNTWFIYGVGVLVVFLLGVIGFLLFILKKRKKKEDGR